jgi:hypothetical protein
MFRHIGRVVAVLLCNLTPQTRHRAIPTEHRAGDQLPSQVILSHRFSWQCIYAGVDVLCSVGSVEERATRKSPVPPSLVFATGLFAEGMWRRERHHGHLSLPLPLSFSRHVCCRSSEKERTIEHLLLGSPSVGLPPGITVWRRERRRGQSSPPLSASRHACV